jgi:hypothetical protein
MTGNGLTLFPATIVAGLEGVGRAPLPQKHYNTMAKNYSLLYQLCSRRTRYHDQGRQLDIEDLFRQKDCQQQRSLGKSPIHTPLVGN